MHWLARRFSEPSRSVTTSSTSQISAASPHDIMIAGGGIGGVAAALCLAQRGHRVQVFERGATFGEAGAGIQLSPNASRVLHALGLEAALKPFAFLPEAAIVRRWNTGACIVRTPLGAQAQAKYGAPYYHIHRGDFLRVLVDVARSHKTITLHENANVTAFTQNPEGVSLDVSGKTHHGDALIGADGIHSTIRSSLWGADTPRFTGNVAWRAMVPTAQLPDGLIAPTATVWWGPRKHFVHYYMRGGTYVNCVCVVEQTGWQTETWTSPGTRAELKAAFAGWHNDIQALIDHAEDDALFKWALHDRAPYAHWGRDRVTLLGDSCHPMLPFMAQGAAMAIEDGAVLATCLSRGASITQALQDYEVLRSSRTAYIQTRARRNADIFHMTGIKAWMRDRFAQRAGQNAMDAIYSYDALTAE